MKRYSIFLIVILVAIFWRSSEIAAIENTHQVITRNEIQQAGLTRIGDLVFLMDRWDALTTDGYSWQMNLQGMGIYDRQSWIVYLDGQRYDLHTLDIQQLNALPVTLGEIDSVVIVNTPQLVEGEFAGQGMIKFFTAKPATGWSARASLMMGNETGDPGPFRFTGYRTPNKDRIGDRESLGLSYGGDNWFAEAAIQSDIQLFPDFYQHGRIRSILDNGPGFLRFLPSLRLGYTGVSGNHQFRLSQVISPEYFLFVSPVGRELPFTFNLTHAGLNGTVSSSGNQQYRYQIQWESTDLGEYENTLDANADWNMQTFYASLDREYSFAQVSGRVGLSYEQQALQSRHLQEKGTSDTESLFGNFRYHLVNGVQQNLDVLFKRQDRRYYSNVSITTDVRLNSAVASSMQIAYSESPLAAQYPSWPLQFRGYGFFDEWVFRDALYESGVSQRVRQLDVDLGFDATLSPEITLGTSLFYRQLKDLWFLETVQSFNPDDCSFFGAELFRGHRSGATAGGNLSLQYHAEERFSAMISYRYLQTVSGGDLFREKWKRIPAHAASARFTYSPVSNFSLWSMIRYQSETYWNEYSGIEGAECVYTENLKQVYSADIQPWISMDIQAKKWFWDRQLAVSLLFRNITNNSYQYHPVGASFELSFFLKIDVVIG